MPPFDMIEILGWAVSGSGASKELHKHLKRAREPDAHDRVVVVSESMRFELLRILAEIGLDHPLTRAQAEVREIAGSSLIVSD